MQASIKEEVKRAFIFSVRFQTIVEFNEGLQEAADVNYILHSWKYLPQYLFEECHCEYEAVFVAKSFKV